MSNSFCFLRGVVYFSGWTSLALLDGGFLDDGFLSLFFGLLILTVGNYYILVQVTVQLSEGDGNRLHRHSILEYITVLLQKKEEKILIRK